MLHVAHPKLSSRQAPRRRRPAAIGRSRVEAPPVRAESNAALLMLAAVVVGDLLLAATVAITGALGG